MIYGGLAMTGEQKTRIYKNRWFAKYGSREGMSDAALIAAVDRVNCGLVDADLGGGLIKQRVARGQRQVWRLSHAGLLPP